MGPDGGAVDPHENRRLADFDKSGENLLPQLAFAPAIVPVENRGVWPILVRKRRQRQPRAQAMDDAADDTPVVFALGPLWSFGRCGSITAHCPSFSQKLSAMIRALLTSLNYGLAINSIGYRT